MSQHPSLRVDSVGAKHRNVLKRYERIKKMQAEGKWGERNSALNLPKMKSIKVKVKKTKEAAAPGAEGAAAAAPAAAAPAKTAAKPAEKGKK
jgi:small basic protein (TIGR04137 family)